MSQQLESPEKGWLNFMDWNEGANRARLTKLLMDGYPEERAKRLFRKCEASGETDQDFWRYVYSDYNKLKPTLRPVDHGENIDTKVFKTKQDQLSENTNETTSQFITLYDAHNNPINIPVSALTNKAKPVQTPKPGLSNDDSEDDDQPLGDLSEEEERQLSAIAGKPIYKVQPKLIVTKEVVFKPEHFVKMTPKSITLSTGEVEISEKTYKEICKKMEDAC